MILIIAEKPSSMRFIASALGVNKKIDSNTLGDNDKLVTHCSGHLYRLMLPKEIDEKYKKWNIENLPFTFKDIPMVKVEDNYIKKTINNIKNILMNKNVTEIVCACDADREGEAIAREVIYELEKEFKTIAQLNKTRIFTRMWYNELTSAYLKKSFNERKKLSLYDNIYLAQKARATADYNVGLTGTQAMTVWCSKEGVMPVGRVQTPTLRMIVDLENDINNFISKNYYKIVAHTKEKIDGELIDKTLDNNRFFDKTEAISVINSIFLGKAKIISNEVKEQSIYPKKLFSMSSLQSEMNRKYNLTAHETLDIAQKLYEAGLTTYPRTEEETVSSQMAKELEQSFSNLPVFENVIKEIKKLGYHLSDKVIAKGDGFTGAHEAITPSNSSATIEKINALSKNEKNVYLAIVERFLENFYPPTIINVQNIIFEKDKRQFKSQFKALKSLGYLKVSGNKSDYGTLVSLNTNDEVEISSLQLVESKTNPPSRFTEASLIETMKNPAKYLTNNNEKSIIKEVNGIGTGATRDTIIEGLKKQNLIRLEKKTIYPTDKGIALIEKIPSELIKSVSITAYFESKLKEIYEGKYSFIEFESEIDRLLKKFVIDVRKIEKVEKKGFFETSKPLCKCPICNGNIVEGKFGYLCSKKCGVNIYKNALEKSLGLKNITQKQAKELFTEGETSEKVKLISNKTKKEYEAFLTYSFDKDNKYPNQVWIKF